MRKLILTLVAACAIGCNGQQDASVDVIPPSEFASLLDATPDAQLIDVRTPEEYSAQNIAGAKNIDWNGDDFEQKASKLDKSKPVFVYCMVGGRSNNAAVKLKKMGFEKVYDLKGGIMKWNAEGLSDVNGGMSLKEYLEIVDDQKILVSFYAEWCGPCKKMKPYMKDLESDTGVKLLRLDADRNKTMVSEMNVDTLPALFLYEDGKITWVHTGFIAEQDLKKQLQ